MGQISTSQNSDLSKRNEMKNGKITNGINKGTKQNKKYRKSGHIQKNAKEKCTKKVNKM